MVLYNMKKAMKFMAVVFLSICLTFAGKNNDKVEASKGSIVRIQGDNRFETSVKISQEAYDQADTVFITDARGFADALAGVPLAYQKQAPILLAQGNKLNQKTINEINRLGASEAIILGGKQAVSSHIEKELRNLGLSTRRLAGNNRFETANVIAKELTQTVPSDSAVIVNGFDFADAMSIAPFAAKYGMPIYLTRPQSLSTKDVKNYVELLIIGGEAAVSSDVEAAVSDESQLEYTIRIAGDNRYETNHYVLNEFGIEANHLYFSTGLDFVDALTGSVLAATENTGIALVKNSPDMDQQRFIRNNALKDYRILGGESAVSQSFVKSLEDYLDSLFSRKIDYQIVEDTYLKRTNNYRRSKGLKPFNKNKALREAAYVLAEEAPDTFGPVRPDGSWFTTAVDDSKTPYNYRAVSSDKSSTFIYASEEKMTNDMFDIRIDGDFDPSLSLNSDNFKDMGVGVYFDGFHLYIVQLLGVEEEENENELVAQEMIDLINKERISEGVEPLKLNRFLSEVAIERSKELTEEFSHSRPDGRPFYTIFEEHGKENLSRYRQSVAVNYPSSSPAGIADSLFGLWSTSPAHYEYITDPDHTEVGVGVEYHQGEVYGTLIYSREDSLN